MKVHHSHPSLPAAAPQGGSSAQPAHDASPAARTEAIRHPQAAQHSQRASEAWRTLTHSLGDGPDHLKETLGGHHAWVWSQAQAIESALDVAQHTRNYRPAEHLLAGLESYRDGKNGYAVGPHPNSSSQKYYDDNSWVGLAQAQAFAQTGKKQYLHQAEHTFEFVESGFKKGGEQWLKGAKTPTYNTCSNGPAGELALHLYRATGKPKYLQFAEKVDAFMDKHLREPSGLYRDHVGDHQASDNAIVSYNQGVGIGLKVQLAQATQNPEAKAKYLAQAQQTAQAALTYFGHTAKGEHGAALQDTRLWRQPPIFNAILFRNLAKLNAVAPKAEYSQTLTAYADQAWSKARDAHGFFTGDGIGSYGGSQLVDQAGMVQILALEGASKRGIDEMG